MLEFSLSDEQKAMQDMIHKFAEVEIRPTLRESEKNGVSDELNKKYHELGLSTIDIPTEYGGQGLDSVTAVIVAEELAWGDVGVAMGFSGPGIAAYAIMELGSEEQKKKFLAPFGKQENFKMKGALAITEPDSGSDIGSLATTAKLVGNEYSINGKKYLVSNGGVADIHVVFACLDKEKGVKAFVVEKDNPGLIMGSVDEKLGLRALHTASIELKDCKVPKENLLNGAENSANAVEKALSKIRLIQAARTIGVARASLEYAVNYSKEREAFGKPIGQHQSLSFMMADMAMEADAARLMVWKAAWIMDKGLSAMKEVSEARVQANEMALKVTTDAVQILGGHGYIQDHPVEKWMRDARTLTMVGGTTEIQNYIISREILGDFEKKQESRAQKAASL